MSEETKTVDSLPEEVLIEVFKLLDSKSMKNVVLTCKKWKDIAEPSIPWSLEIERNIRLFHYDCQNHWQKAWQKDQIDFDILQQSKRLYTSLTLFGLSVRTSILTRSGMMGTMQKLAPNIATLKVFIIQKDEIQELFEFLTLFPNLKKIFVDVDREVDADLGSVNGSVGDPGQLFPKLSDLEVRNQFVALELFKNAQLTSLRLYRHTANMEALFVKSESMFLTRFLSTQRNLKKLILENLDHEIELPEDKENIPFELKVLSLCGYGLSHLTLQSLQNFLEFQSKSIETLEMSSRLPDVILDLVFAKFENLKTLHLNCHQYGYESDDLSFYDRFKVNTSVTTLTLRGSFSKSAQHIFKLLPNIENLEILGETKLEVLQAVDKNLKKVKSMKLSLCFGSDFQSQNILLNFQSLEALSVGFVDDVWSLLSSVAPGFKHLYIDHIGADLKHCTNIEKIIRKFNLESLTINGNIKADKDFFDAVRQSSLKSLNLIKRSLVSVGPNKIRMSELADIRGLRLYDEPIADPFKIKTSLNP